MINLHIDELEKRWGKFKKLKNAYGNCPMNFIKTPHDDLFYSNMLFDVVPLNSYETIYNKIQNCEMPNFLKEIYSITNGLHFFCDSLVIMGDVKNYSRDDLYRPAEYFPTCHNAFQRFRDYYKAKTGKDYLPIYYFDSEYKIFGWMGNSKFAFKPNDEKIYVLTNGDNCDLIKIYNNFQECWDHYFYGLMKLYDDDGRKKEPNEIFIKHFWYGHKTFKDF